MAHGGKWGLVLAAALLEAGQALALDADMTVAGHRVQVVGNDDTGEQHLLVDGQPVHSDFQIVLDEAPREIGGMVVVTGIAGAGGNACNATPFVLALPKGGAPMLSGPVQSCAWMAPQEQGDSLVYTSEPLPELPGEHWIWTPDGGFVAGPPIPFVATKGWEALDDLAMAHPVEAMTIAPVDSALRDGLGSDYAVFAERIQALGSGDLVAGGYLGQACLKFNCDQDYALLYVDRASQQVFAAWHVEGELENHLWPQDIALWPREVLLAIPFNGGE